MAQTRRRKPSYVSPRHVPPWHCHRHMSPVSRVLVARVGGLSGARGGGSTAQHVRGRGRRQRRSPAQGALTGGRRSPRHAEAARDGGPGSPRGARHGVPCAMRPDPGAAPGPGPCRTSCACGGTGGSAACTASPRRPAGRAAGLGWPAAWPRRWSGWSCSRWTWAGSLCHGRDACVLPGARPPPPSAEQLPPVRPSLSCGQWAQGHRLGRPRAPDPST